MILASTTYKTEKYHFSVFLNCIIGHDDGRAISKINGYHIMKHPSIILPLILFFTVNLFGQKTPPNIIFILADDLGWADLPVYGNTFNEAPHISRLAEEGIRFTNAYAGGPVCSPTRASIQSGQHTARVGITDYITGHWRPYEEVIVPKNRTQYLPENIITIAEALKPAGYATAYFGKWHLGKGPDHHPLAQGYDEANTGNGIYNVNMKPPREEHKSDRFSERITAYGNAFIRKNKDKPFFLFLSHFDVHVQLDADNDLIRKYQSKEKDLTYPSNPIYAAMIEHIDRSVAQVVQTLEEEGLTENTMIIFFSDNGGLISRFDRIPLIAKSKLELFSDDNALRYIASTNAPLRAEKGTLYEGGIREPLIVKWPGNIPPGKVSEAPVTSQDFYPTLLELAGVDRPDKQVLDGISLIPTFTSGHFDPERVLYWHYPVYHHDVPASAIRKGDWKLIENLVTGNTSLYNLASDIGEQMDLSELYPDKTKELYDLLQKWQQEVKAEFPKPNPNFNPERRKEWGKHPDRR